MSPGARKVLEELAADDDIDLAQEGRYVYCGNRQTTGRVVKELLGVVAISVTSKDGLMGSFTTFAINDTGRALLRRPELEGDLMKAIYGRRRRPFSIVDDRVKFISK